jgi:hypothetical protein
MTALHILRSVLSFRVSLIPGTDHIVSYVAAVAAFMFVTLSVGALAIQ